MNRRRYKKPEPYEKRCENCHYCMRISDGDYMCEKEENVVIKDRRRTEHYRQCRDPVYVLEKKPKN